MKLMFLGAPGSGKGTQAEKVVEKYNIPAISTGNIIREAIAAGSQLGKQVQDYITQGLLVPDEIVIGLVQERLSQDDCANGFILDGFPRTVPQAEALDKMGVFLDKVIDLDVQDEVIKQRMSGRRVCKGCGASYHTEFHKPQTDGVCDKCGNELIIRADDKPETVAERLKVYHEQTEPLVDFYKSKGILKQIKGQSSIEETTVLFFKALEEE